RYAEHDEVDDPAEIQHFIQTFGLDRMGPAGMRMALDGQLLRTGMFAAAPGPRRGLIALFDQPTLQPQPAAWVAADVQNYTHISADLGQIDETVEDLVIELVGDEARGFFEEMTQSSQMFLQASPRDILASVGARHTMLEFAARTVA